MLNTNQIINSKEIPIFFATDDNYIPCLYVAISSLIENASKDYKYVINVLNTGLKQENKDIVRGLENDNFSINFCDISEKVADIKSQLRDIYHFSVVMYYRLFIESLFPQYDKALYLDCDIVVLGDISKLFNVNLDNNLVGAVREQVVYNHPVFSEYAEKCIGVSRENYFNSGILLMNLAEFRNNKIQDKFIDMIRTYNFDVIDPDQAYLNFLCRGKVKKLPTGWNKESIPEEKVEGDLNIVHYALYKKPWQYKDVLNGEYFWNYAKKSPFNERFLKMIEEFDDEKKAAKEKANVEIVEHGLKVINLDKTFYNVYLKNKHV